MRHRLQTRAFRLHCLLGAALVGLCLSAVAAPKTGKAPVNAAVMPAAEVPSVKRFIIRYRTGIKMDVRGAGASGTERAQAAAQVARSAGLAGESRMHYLKSVSPSLHVATLDQLVTPAEAQALVQRLQADPAVLDAMVDQRVKSHLVPNDPYYTGGQQWHLQPSSVIPGGLNVNNAWDRSTGAGVVIAVLDGGYVTHADLLPNILRGYDFVSADDPAEYGGDAFWTSNDGNARDPYALDPGDWVTDADVTAGYCDLAEDSTWHGSHVAGLAAAVGNNSQSGLGVAFGAKILPVRVLGRCGGYVADILTGARWAVGLAVPDLSLNPTPARILNLSLGVPPNPAAPGCNSVIQDVVNEIRARNVSIVASSGNDGNTQISVPANCQGVFAVTAHTREGDSADYANVGVGVRVSAAGGGLNTVLPELPGSPRAIVSTGNAGTTVPTSDADLLLQGTSMAAPQVTGVLALLAAARPDLPMATLEGFVTGSARPFPAGGYCATNPNALAAGFCGSGLLDADAAMAAALGYSASSGGGGGCTSASGGQTDLGLLLLALLGLGGTIWRRRPAR